MIYLDTHVVAWLYAGLVERLSARARELINERDLYVSPMVQLELQYLYETGKTDRPGQEVTGDLAQRIGLRFCTKPFSEVVAAALEQDWTRDPFDRIIVGQAALSGSDLLTRDELMLQNYSRALWP